MTPQARAELDGYLDDLVAESGLRGGEADSVRADLSEHLADLYAEMRSRGLPETAAAQAAIAEFGEAGLIGRSVGRAKRDAHARVWRRRVSAVGAVAAMIALAVGTGVGVGIGVVPESATAPSTGGPSRPASDVTGVAVVAVEPGGSRVPGTSPGDFAGDSERVSAAAECPLPSVVAVAVSVGVKMATAGGEASADPAADSAGDGAVSRRNRHQGFWSVASRFVFRLFTQPRGAVRPQ
jgi:hypothetical protein